MEKLLVLGVGVIGLTGLVQLILIIKFFGLCGDVAAMRKTLAGIAKRDLDREIAKGK